MLPGLSSAVEASIRKVLTPSATALRADHYEQADTHLFGGRDEPCRALGVTLLSGPELMLAVTDPVRPVGDIRVQTAGTGCLLFLDNRAWQGSLSATIRMLGNDTAVIVNDIGPGGYVALHDVFLRSHRQFLFWGRGATAVGLNIELEGQDRGLVIGDDALIANGVWIRNYNMHALHDLRSGAPIGRPPDTIVLERHVWLGQDSLLLNCGRVGAGAVVGARSLVTRPVPSCVIAAGNPATVRREAVSWGRDTYRMTGAERVALGWPETPGG
jgi:carbonic anhydrase/acetyltransferase-like protein (isoleucine patch superfamily)